jgi:sigma-B regulation protein RsbU (phosphoserine phosphatase)
MAGGDAGGGVRLRTRMTVLAVVALVLLAVAALVVRAAYSDADQVARDVGTRLSPASDLASDLLTLHDRTYTESREYVITGAEESRARYELYAGLAARTLDELDRLLGSDPGLGPRVQTVRAAVADWLPPVVEPAVAAREAGPLSPDRLEAFLQRTAAAYQPVAAADAELITAVNAERDGAFTELASVADRLSAALVAAGVLALLTILAASVLLGRWVLRPLDELRRQLRSVAAGHRDDTIDASGPPELAAAGRDAEAMRRALVAEADAARAADESLALQGPVVEAIRRELAVDPDPVAPGLIVHGRLHPAEGVLAGDWWGTLTLPDGRTAVLLIDVSGHGALAGLVTLRLRTVMAVALRSGFDPATVLGRAATALADSADGRFATALVVLIDPGNGTVTWANAGHPAGWLLTHGTVEDRVPLSPTGPLLSALGGSWRSRSADLWPGDVLLLWSDGLTETRRAAEELDDAALARLVTEIGTGSVAELVDGLVARLREGAAEWRRDDVTVVAVRREG